MDWLIVGIGAIIFAAFGAVLAMLLILMRWVMDLYEKIDRLCMAVDDFNLDQAQEQLAVRAMLEEQRRLIDGLNFALVKLVDGLGLSLGVDFDEKKSKAKK